MELLEGTLRAYPWGSRTLIPEMRGEEAPSGRPEAEVWFGAHPGAPSTINGTALNQLIADDPVGMLGERVAREFDGQLPFLLKILAAGAPLSLQAHPSLEQAREGFQRENEAGIEFTAPNRNYRDANHKPELIVALSDFIAMAGFRPLARTLEIFDAIECHELDHYRSMIAVDAEEESLRALFTTWITIPVTKRHELINAIIASAHRYLEQGGQEWIRFVLSHIVELHDRYPGDVGVLGALLLNFYQLKPGEGIYLDAGNLHAYIYGLGVEIMANSDNVLRGGLTSKYVDVPELVRVLDFKSLGNAVVDCVSEGNIHRYPVPVSEFTLDRVRLTGSHDAVHDGPMIILCTESAGGPVLLEHGGQRIELTAGYAVWVPASDGLIGMTADDAEVFIATV
ncbi:mannose-6-phosphate isomerase, class I [Corynebacterium efficiens YS-314]|uniref:mannose-6-phosphate isomerase n=1 Tax=Corynebacterium efficiens (strain DSM 44549 / YS-314 / AJ 12310 / JCM 11189 / NBRC 100395) TaxID=196164 RepID=Q8FRJ7_COREF|nr:mannose-6-phosphate isomerase, class I [Corynebacterium efficiens]EEW50516.1 mannose-6-phosphate isomerase, class I [Corynebacterium efficiens YS-314]BAC17574.1 putative mannose-6-phosphate isomerase [Corynebacterium efficiens YS-314]